LEFAPNCDYLVTDNGNPALYGQNTVTVFLRDVVGARPVSPFSILDRDVSTMVLPTVKKAGMKSLAEYFKRSI